MLVVYGDICQVGDTLAIQQAKYCRNAGDIAVVQEEDLLCLIRLSRHRRFLHYRPLTEGIPEAPLYGIALPFGDRPVLELSSPRRVFLPTGGAFNINLVLLG